MKIVSLCKHSYLRLLNKEKYDSKRILQIEIDFYDIKYSMTNVIKQTFKIKNFS